MVFCSKCKLEKPYEEFHKNKKRGFAGYCKLCCKIMQKEYRTKNSIELREKKKIYYKQNQEKVKQQVNTYRKNNPNKAKESNIKWLNSHKEENAIKCKEYREKPENKEKIKQGKEKYKPRRRELQKIRWVEDNKYRFDQKLRARMKKALTAQGSKKAKKTEELIGCTIAELKEWLEKQFTPEMSWDKRESFHIDHILPCSEFDLRNSEEQEICFHYTNLQPLTPLENLKKSNKVL